MVTSYLLGSRGFILGMLLVYFCACSVRVRELKEPWLIGGNDVTIALRSVQLPAPNASGNMLLVPVEVSVVNTTWRTLLFPYKELSFTLSIARFKDADSNLWRFDLGSGGDPFSSLPSGADIKLAPRIRTNFIAIAICSSNCMTVIGYPHLKPGAMQIPEKLHYRIENRVHASGALSRRHPFVCITGEGETAIHRDIGAGEK